MTRRWTSVTLFVLLPAVTSVGALIILPILRNALTSGDPGRMPIPRRQTTNPARQPGRSR